MRRPWPTLGCSATKKRSTSLKYKKILSMSFAATSYLYLNTWATYNSYVQNAVTEYPHFCQVLLQLLCHWTSGVVKVIRFIPQFPSTGLLLRVSLFKSGDMTPSVWDSVTQCFQWTCVSIFEVCDVQAERSETLTQRHSITSEKTCIGDCLLRGVGTLFVCSRERKINFRPANQLS